MTPDTQIRRHAEDKKAATSTAYESEAVIDDETDPVTRRSASSTANRDDLERGSPHHEREDPFGMSSKLKSADEIASIRTSISRRNSTFGSMAPSKDTLKARKVKSFYEDQNENIERLLKPVDEHVRQAKEETESDKLQYKIAVYGSFAANIILAGLQLYGAIASGSLSLFTTMADALFDPLSNLTLILCHRAVQKVDGRKFPAGKARIENAGNISFCHLMCAVSLILIVLSARELAEGAPVIDGRPSSVSEFHLQSIIAVATAFCVKFGLFLYCWGLRNKYSQVRILWEDHRNDLIINGVGIATSVMGSKIRWFIDPLGAIILSVLIITLWLHTSFKEFEMLVGKTADPSTLQLLTYICKSHTTPPMANLLTSDSRHTRSTHCGDRHSPSLVLRAATHC